MSAPQHLLVSGPAPYAKSGTYEIIIAICGERPSDTAIRNRNFPVLWEESFHLRVIDGRFEERLGSAGNPVPADVFARKTVWVVVADVFTENYSIFETVSVHREERPAGKQADDARLKEGGGPQGPVREHG